MLLLEPCVALFLEEVVAVNLCRSGGFGPMGGAMSRPATASRELDRFFALLAGRQVQMIVDDELLSHTLRSQ